MSSVADNTRSSTQLRTHDDYNQRFAAIEDNQLTLNSLVGEIARSVKEVSRSVEDISRRLSSLETKPSFHPTDHLDLDGDTLHQSPTHSTYPPPKPPFNSTNIRGLKFDMPSFNGDDPDGWLFKAEQYLDYYELRDNQKFTLASAAMEGHALAWYRSISQSRQLTTWEQFKSDLLVRFGPSPFQDLRGELTKLHQETTVQDFYNRFEQLSTQVLDVPPLFLQSCFESGLRADIQMEVRALQPRSLAHAFQLAKLMEDRMANLHNSLPLLSNRPQPSPPPLHARPNPPPPSNDPSTPIRRLTPEQIVERRSKGLCFNCDDRFHRGHICKARLFMMVTTNDDIYEDYGETGNGNTARDSNPIDYG